ncbi:MAG: hypothetical protein KGL39_02855 [Patescibacteria group bacterium]|nr:hypothetical protein [Patescibacteria group bacterium]
MKTLEQEWQDYQRKVYPKSVSDVQYRECRQAFIAGAFVAHAQLEQISALPDEQAVAALGKLNDEAKHLMAAMAVNAKSRN